MLKKYLLLFLLLSFVLYSQEIKQNNEIKPYETEKLASSTSSDLGYKNKLIKYGLSERNWKKYKESDYSSFKEWAQKEVRKNRVIGIAFSSLAAWGVVGNIWNIAIKHPFPNDEFLSYGVITSELLFVYSSLIFFKKAYIYDKILEGKESNNVFGLKEIGFKNGLNISTARFYNDFGDVDYYKPKFGYLAGFYLSFYLSNIIAFQPEILFVQKGVKMVDYYDFNILNKQDRNYLLNFLEIPLFLKFTLPIENPLKPSFFIGPSSAFLFSEKMESETGDYTTTYKNPFKQYEFSLEYGINFLYKLKKGSLVFEIRNIEALYRYNIYLKNRTYSCIIGYSFK